MHWFADIPIRRKVTLVILLTSCVAILSAATIFIFADSINSRRVLIRELSTIAEIVGANSRAAVVFDDEKAAKRILSALANKPNIVSALILRPDFRVIAAHERKPEGQSADRFKPPLINPAQTRQAVARVGSDGGMFVDGYVDIAKPIVLDGETVGFVVLRSGVGYVYDQLSFQLATAFFATLISILIATLISYRLQRFITAPITHLAHVMERVAHDKSYNTRAKKWSNDELGILIDGFNTMLEKIESNEHNLAAKIRAETANRAKSEFLANMSHELRTPLNAIIGFSEMMIRESFGPLGSYRYNSYAEDIHGSGTHLLGIINDILDLSKAEAGKLTLCEDEVDLHVLIQQCMRMMRAAADDNRIRIVPRVSVELPRLRADARLVTQAVINLATNAVKFTPEGGFVVISIDSHVDGSCAICIEDNGIGIAEEDLEKIREPFAQVANAFTRSHEGTGLGLPLVDQIMTLHGGSLTIESEWGKGTLAAIRFPKERVIEPGDALEPRLAVKPGVGSEKLKLVSANI